MSEPPIPDEDMEFGRTLIVNGRNWLHLTNEDVDRGARAVVRDRQYRADVARHAIRYAYNIENPALAAACLHAWAELSEGDEA